MPHMPIMPMWNNGWNGWAWAMALWMIGATLVWIAVIALMVWLIARWETWALRRVNLSAPRAQYVQDVQDAGGEADTGRFDDVSALQASGSNT